MVHSCTQHLPSYEHERFAAGEEGKCLLRVLHSVSLGEHLLHTHSAKMLCMGRPEESCLCLKRQERFLCPWKQPSSLLVEDLPTQTGMRQQGEQAGEAEEATLSPRQSRETVNRQVQYAGRKDVLWTQSKNSVAFVAPNSCCITVIQPLAQEQPGGEDLSHKGTAVLDCASPSYSYSDSASAFPSLKCSMFQCVFQ